MKVSESRRNGEKPQVRAGAGKTPAISLPSRELKGRRVQERGRRGANRRGTDCRDANRWDAAPKPSRGAGPRRYRGAC